jgi:hypothetical protein
MRLWRRRLMPEINPEEALAAGRRLNEQFQTAGIIMPPNLAEFGAAMVLIYADAMKSGCQCQTCTDVRQTLNAFMGA